MKTEGWCPPENYSDVHSAIILSKYYNFSIGTTGQRYFSGEARFITASTNRWYIPRHGLDNTESLEYALTLLEEAVKNKKHLALYAHDTADTGDRDRLLNVIKASETIRASMYFYNTKEEIDKFIDVCKEVTLDKCIGVFL